MDAETICHFKDLNRSHLRAETARIRFLRLRSRQELSYARRPGLQGDRRALHVARAMRRLRASECPSQRARCANLALGFLNGRSYWQIEKTTRTPRFTLLGDLAREVAKKAGVDHEEIAAWMRHSLDVPG